MMTKIRHHSTPVNPDAVTAAEMLIHLRFDPELGKFFWIKIPKLVRCVKIMARSYAALMED